ncbi:hypothetical protein NJC10_05325 [Micrococcus sp. M4NT]|uniref:PqqD family protein n=1 Tax=Micrococcus sp. M4NT TaxID=2957501 RepID=UPI0029B2031A|nr:PqqD family peptide modification chaperone [Micrococcus sp. M4NT]MDX2341090.1 hypothetical protein [Micrococcus sp. M4NT]
MPTSDAGTPRSLRLTAGLDTLTVSGLDETASETLCRDWSRCSPTPIPTPAAADLERAEGQDWDVFHESIVYAATSAAIGSCRGTHLMFHGACLAVPETGAAVVLAAASGTGKTTATRRLGPHFAYLTDETAIVDPADLGVTPYAKPLSLLGDAGVRPKHQVGPDGLGLGPTVPGTVRRVAVLDRVRDATEAVPARAEPLPLLEALQLLVPQTSSLSQLPRGLVTLCGVLDRVGGAHRLVYTEAEGLRPVLDRLLADAPVRLDRSWDPLEDDELAPSSEPTSPTSPTEAGEPSTDPRRIRRRGADDGILTADHTLVLLHDTELVMLAGLGPAIWFLLTEPLTPEEILDRLSSNGPVPPDAADRVEAAVAQLSEQGLLRAE